MPFHTEVLTPAAPQLKPIVCLTRFSSLRRLPAQTRVTGSSRAGIASRSSIVKLLGVPTRPSTLSLCSDLVRVRVRVRVRARARTRARARARVGLGLGLGLGLGVCS